MPSTRSKRPVPGRPKPRRPRCSFISCSARGTRMADRPESEQLAFERVEDVLVRLAALGELEPEPTHAVFVRALNAEVNITRGRSGRFGEGVVYGPLAAVAGHDLDAVFILGCTEGLWAHGSPRRRVVAGFRAGVVGGRAPVARCSARRPAPGLSRRPGRCAGWRTLTFARGDLRGNRKLVTVRGGSSIPPRPSPVTRSTPRTSPNSVRPPSRWCRRSPVGSRHLFTVRGANTTFAVLAQFADAGGEAVDHPLATLTGHGFEVQLARRSAAFTEWDGNLAGQPIPSATDRSLSPTRLESWAACGYRYFLAYVLDLTDRDDPERVIDLSPLERGSGVHTVLERFLTEVIEGGVPDPQQPWTRPNTNESRDHRRGVRGDGGARPYRPPLALAAGQGRVARHARRVPRRGRPLPSPHRIAA